MKESVYLVLTHDGYIKRSSIKSYKACEGQLPGLKDGDSIVLSQIVNTTDYVLAFTNLGNYMFIPVHEIIENIIKLGKELNKPVVATSDAHYVDQKDAIYRKILIAAQRSNPSRNKTQPDLHFYSTQEMLDALFNLEKEINLLRNQHPNCQLNEWLDNQEVCEILNISLRTLQYLKNRGNITFTQIGRKTYYHKQEVMNLIKGQQYGKNTDKK